MSILNVAYNAATVFNPNTWTATGPFGGVNAVRANQQSAQFRFDFYGEQLDVQMISGAGANPITVQVDGGSLSTPTIPNGTMAYYTIASGLSLGWHTVVVRTTLNATSIHFATTTGAFRVTASDNNPQTRLSPGFGAWMLQGATGMLADGKTTVSSQQLWTTNQSVSGGYRADRFRAKTDKLPAFFNATGATCYVALYVDGVAAGSPAVIAVPATAGGYFDFVDIAALVGATLDGTAFHEYEVVWATSVPTVSAFVAGYAATTSFDTTATYAARARDAYVGDSICAGFLLATPFLSWTYIASRARGAIAVTSAASGSQEVVDGPTKATAIATWAPFDNVWNEYGTNDMAAIGTSTPTSAWSTADISTLNNMLTAAPAGKVLRLGILPRSSYDATKRAAWNGTAQYGAQYNITQSNAPARITYVDPLSIGLVDPTDYSETSPTERLHPNAAGQAKMAAIAIAAMAPVAIISNWFSAA